MNLQRFQNEHFWQGQVLQIKETTEEGYALLELHLPEDAVLFQYKQQVQFIFSNRKRADGIVFFQDGDDQWGMLLVELKRSVNSGKWDSIKQQWHGAWLHATAIAAVLGIRLSGRVEVMVAYRQQHMGDASPDPVLLKGNIENMATTHSEWMTGLVDLEDAGTVRLHQQALDVSTGTGSYTFTPV